MQAVIWLSLSVVILFPLVCWLSGQCGRWFSWRQPLTEACLVVLVLIQDLQLHRGLSGALLDRRRDFLTELEDNEYKLQRSLQVLSDQYGNRFGILHGEQWRIVLGRWEALRDNWHELGFSTNTMAHSEVIHGLLGILHALCAGNVRRPGPLQSRVVTEWPGLIEDLGLLRALGLHLLGHRAGREDQRHCKTIAAHLEQARSTLQAVAAGVADQALVLRTERALRRVSWLLDGNAERYHPYTFYEEMTGVIDDWYALLRHRLQCEPAKPSVRQRLTTWFRLHPKTG